MRGNHHLTRRALWLGTALAAVLWTLHSSAAQAPRIPPTSGAGRVSERVAPAFFRKRAIGVLVALERAAGVVGREREQEGGPGAVARCCSWLLR